MITTRVTGLALFIAGGAVLVAAEATPVRGFGAMLCIAGFIVLALDLMRRDLKRAIAKSRADSD